jgi:hypothetical protein
MVQAMPSEEQLLRKQRSCVLMYNGGDDERYDRYNAHEADDSAALAEQLVQPISWRTNTCGMTRNSSA